MLVPGNCASYCVHFFYTLTRFWLYNCNNIFLCVCTCVTRLEGMQATNREHLMAMGWVNGWLWPYYNLDTQSLSTRSSTHTHTQVSEHVVTLTEKERQRGSQGTRPWGIACHSVSVCWEVWQGTCRQRQSCMCFQLCTCSRHVFLLVVSKGIQQTYVQVSHLIMYTHRHWSIFFNMVLLLNVTHRCNIIHLESEWCFSCWYTYFFLKGNF